MIFGIVDLEGLQVLRALPAVKNLPPSVRIQETGDAEVMGEVFASFAQAMIMGLMLVFVVLILLFGSIFHAFTILLSLPLAVGGVAAALYLTGYAVSMPVVIGILMLMGIVTKNAIMLVDFAVERVKHGMTRNQAILDAGSKTLTADPGGGLDGFGEILDYPQARIHAFAEEHGFLDLSRSNDRPNVGDVVRVVPNHVCVVVNMVDQLITVRGSEIVGVLPVAARGRLV